MDDRIEYVRRLMDSHAELERVESEERTARFKAFWREALTYLDWEREYFAGTWGQVADILAPSIGALVVAVAEMRAEGQSQDEVLDWLVRTWREG